MNQRGATMLAAPGRLESRLAWPEQIVDNGGAAPQTLLRIDDPLVESIWKGDSVLGWEGEDRLRLYACPQTQTWELLRFCPDGVMRTIHRLPFQSTPLAAVPGKMMLWLVEHDAHRGFDLLAHLDAEEAKVAKARDEAHTEAWAENLPRAQHAWQKKFGVAESHLPFTVGFAS